MLQMYVSLFTVEPRVIAQQIFIVQEGNKNFIPSILGRKNFAKIVIAVALFATFFLSQKIDQWLEIFVKVFLKV